MARISRISRVVADLDRSEAFYRDGLGFEKIGGGPGDPKISALLGLSGATLTSLVMRLGAQEIELACFDPPGAPYPADSRSDDLWFQHLAIVVGDMDAAYASLVRQRPEAISIGGPQTLPRRNGGVVAYKFRDPDGHPLELIHFPPGVGREVWRRVDHGPFLGIDHSALSVGSAVRSVRFYGDLGFTVADRSSNYGPAQSSLDGLVDARVRVVGLRQPDDDGPGLELLAYQPPGRAAPRMAANSRVTDWVSLVAPGAADGVRLASGARAAVRRDPDGHIILLLDHP
ncbi:MAG: VOC family protein [Pseudomonadota bacterium]|nr:VOC family protein [Pseudomonadota bacterium]